MHPTRRWLAALLFGWAAMARPALAAETAFRLTDLDFRDPHFFVSFLGCRDITDTPLAGFSINGEVQTSITTDGDDDGLLDLSYLIVFEPLDQGAAVTTGRFGTVECSAPVATTSCMHGATGVLHYATFHNSAGPSPCLAPVAGTLRPYAPAVVSSSAPCFSTEPMDVTLDVGLGFPLPLRDYQVSARYVGNPATQLNNGLIRGFLTEADANAIILPASFPLVGGMPLSAMLPGGSGNCASHSDKDTHEAQVGWWFYANFTASPVPFTDPLVSVGDPVGSGVELGQAFPNPFAGALSLDYSLDVASAVDLSIYDVNGRRVADLVRSIESPGRHRVRWDGTGPSGEPAEAGTYFVRLEARGRISTRRVVLLK